MRPPVPAVVLAAGASRRLGKPKQLLLLGSETLLQRAIRIANEAGTAPVIAVLGAHAEKTRSAIDLEQSIVEINNEWESGIAGSIQTGLHAVANHAPDATGVLLLTCDQARLTAGHLRSLLDAFDAQNCSTIVASTYAGTTGVPAIFPRAAFEDLLALRGDQGARALLRQSTRPLVTVPFAGGEVDIDLPGDVAQLQ